MSYMIYHLNGVSYPAKTVKSQHIYLILVQYLKLFKFNLEKKKTLIDK